MVNWFWQLQEHCLIWKYDGCCWGQLYFHVCVFDIFGDLLSYNTSSNEISTHEKLTIQQKGRRGTKTMIALLSSGKKLQMHYYKRFQRDVSSEAPCFAITKTDNVKFWVALYGSKWKNINEKTYYDILKNPIVEYNKIKKWEKV